MIAFVVTLIILLAPGIAYSVGPVVSPQCVVAWIAPTTRVDGTAISGTLTYNLYLAVGNQSQPPAGPPTIAGVGSSPYLGACSVLAAGQYTIWATAVETLSSTAKEGPPTAGFPFVLQMPITPTSPPQSPAGLSVRDP